MFEEGYCGCSKPNRGFSEKSYSTIHSGKFLENSKGTPTFLNAGGYYRNAPLTIVIWADTRKDLNNTPEEFYKGKEVCITGKIELYKDKPQIVVTSKSQIVEQIIDRVDDKEPKYFKKHSLAHSLIASKPFPFASYLPFPLWHIYAITPIALWAYSTGKCIQSFASKQKNQ